MVVENTISFLTIFRSQRADGRQLWAMAFSEKMKENEAIKKVREVVSYFFLKTTRAYPHRIFRGILLKQFTMCN